MAATGTNGKSSTVDFCRQIWAGAGLKAASMGTLGAIGPAGKIDVGHTTPDPVTIHETLTELTRQGVTHCAMEASSHGLEQHRLDGVDLSAVAFLNFTQDHLDYHATMEEYLDAKLRLECTDELKMRLIRPGARAKHHLLDDLKEFLQMVGNVRRGRSSRIGIGALGIRATREVNDRCGRRCRR